MEAQTQQLEEELDSLKQLWEHAFPPNTAPTRDHFIHWLRKATFYETAKIVNKTERLYSKYDRKLSGAQLFKFFNQQMQLVVKGKTDGTHKNVC